MKFYKKRDLDEKNFKKEAKPGEKRKDAKKHAV
jgi:hypothetical protein